MWPTSRRSRRSSPALPTGGWLKPDASDLAVQSAAGEAAARRPSCRTIPPAMTIIQFKRNGNDAWYWAYGVNPGGPKPGPKRSRFKEGLTLELRDWAGDDLDSWAKVRAGPEEERHGHRQRRRRRGRSELQPRPPRSSPPSSPPPIAASSTSRRTAPTASSSTLTMPPSCSSTASRSSSGPAPTTGSTGQVPGRTREDRRQGGPEGGRPYPRGPSRRRQQPRGHRHCALLWTTPDSQVRPSCRARPSRSRSARPARGR